MFTLNRSETLKVKVVTQVAMENGGWTEESFVGVFERTLEAQREEMQALPHTDFLRLKLKGWQMDGPDRQPVEFNPQNLEGLLQLSGVCRDAVQAYWRANFGIKEKN